MPRLFYFQPFSKEGLGRAYNTYAELLPEDDDWAVITDFDVMMFCSQQIDEQIREAIEQYPQFQVLTATTSRLCGAQQVKDVPGIRDERDIVKLKQEADRRAKIYRGRVTPLKGFFAGFFFAFSKRTWKQNPFPVKGAQGGKHLGVDSLWSRQLTNKKVPVGLMHGIMAVHFYRLDTGESNIEHLDDKDHMLKAKDAWAQGARNAPPPFRRLNDEPAAYLDMSKAVPTKLVSLNPGVRPPGGFRFIDAHGLNHFASDFPKLVKTLTDYRRRLGWEVGDPQTEIMAQFYRKFPRICRVHE